MLNDRRHMRRNPEENARGGLHALFGLIAANLIIFIIQHMMPGADVTQQFALSVYHVRKLELWRFFSAMFLHGGFMHFFFNMFGLYIFGSLAAPLLGAKRFLLLYLISGTLGNVLWFFVNWNNPNMWLIGASGAVMGVILASAMILPDIPMLLLFVPFPIKLKTLAIVYIVIEIFSQLTSPGSQTAYLAHIFGFVCGYLYMILFVKDLVVWNPLSSGRKQESNGLPPGWEVSSGPEPSVSRREVERLLIKLSREGINALTEEEQETLRKAREEMMNRR